MDRAFWGLGIGRALTEACIACAGKAGYAQLELEAVAENRSALALYQDVGFVEYGRNPKGFRSRLCGWQELVLMRLELNKRTVKQDAAEDAAVELMPITEDNFLDAFQLKLAPGQIF